MQTTGTGDEKGAWSGIFRDRLGFYSALIAGHYVCTRRTRA